MQQAPLRAAASDTTDAGTLGTAVTVAGAVFNPVVLYSEWVLKTTGSGLPPGPGGLYGAAEGIGYLVVVGIVGWSIATKVTSFNGLKSNACCSPCTYAPMLYSLVSVISHN